ncbi:hypothetical protein J1N35_025680 [Gossypium stocksii]|uniref:Uncharacterized protein n=1 Tax=Gossypium stocksii TaxID=47602 RepID=A0A9D3ZXE0_9ROSI|nr:hypothetical protein J1N35_025680 [Gossypium stocksii]
MEESGGDDQERRDEISLLLEKFIQLSVKGSIVAPNTKPTLICRIWTEKLYNLESFKAQMKSSCLPEYDKKDLLHAIGVTFGRVIRSEISVDSCRLRINLDVQKSLRREGKKRLKQEGIEVSEGGLLEAIIENSEQLDNLNILRSAAAKRQADRTQ